MDTAKSITADEFRALCADLLTQPGPLLLILHRVQEKRGFVPPSLVPIIAKELNLSRAEIHGVVSFYHDFRDRKPGKYVVKVCQAEACQAMGAEQLTEHIQSKLGIDLHSTDKNGEFTLEPTYCLGNCALSPAIMINGALCGRVTPQRFDQLAQELVEIE
jgi:formate dehydrogenase subunit gamma